MNKKFTVVICNPTEPIGLGQKVYGGVVSAAYDRELSDAQPAVAVNQRMRTALQEIANTVNYAQWYQETAEKALEDANHTEVALDKVAAVAVNEQDRLDAARYRWLFGARTEDECQNWKVGHLPLKPQDRVIGQVATVFMPKVAVDGEIDAAIAAETTKNGGV